MVWAVLTKSAISIYDSQVCRSVAYVTNIHYDTLTDICWSPDGKVLLVASLEGFCSFLK